MIQTRYNLCRSGISSMKQILPTYSDVRNSSHGSSVCVACTQISSSNFFLKFNALAFVVCIFRVGTLRISPTYRVWEKMKVHVIVSVRHRVIHSPVSFRVSLSIPPLLESAFIIKMTKDCKYSSSLRSSLGVNLILRFLVFARYWSPIDG